MSIEFFISRTWRYLSILAFVIILLFTYRGLPDPTAVHFGPNGRGDGFLPKNEVFYLFAAVMFTFNILSMLLANSVKRLPINAFQWIPNKKWLQAGNQLNVAIVNWLNFLPAIVNSFLVLCLRALLTLNDERSFQTDYTYLLVVGIVVIMIWLFYLPIKLLYTHPTVEED